MSEIISPVIEELAERAMAFTGGREGYYPTPIDGVSFTVHGKAGGACTCSVYEPSFALMLQGRKRSECGKSVYEYGAGDCMLVNVDIPARYTILEATPDKPFIGCSLKLDSVAVTEMIAKLPGLEDLEDRHARAIVVSRASAAMEADFLSLMRMFDSPTEMKLRAPILIRDIYSRKNGRGDPQHVYADGALRSRHAGGELAENELSLGFYDRRTCRARSYVGFKFSSAL